MKFSKKSITKAGDILKADDAEVIDYATSAAKVDTWRKLHIKPLQDLSEQLELLFAQKKLPFAFSSNRIKRMPSIIDKLKNNAKMGLGNLNDIGGLRFVFDDIPSLLKAQQILNHFEPLRFELKYQHDYIQNVKKSGYRSIHYIYEYHTDDSDYDGLKIELQIRTILQHSWAMAVETASMISKVSLKADIADGSKWREFFILSSAIFSMKEDTPLVDEYKDLPRNVLCKKILSYHKEYKLIDQLTAIREVTEKRPPKDDADGFYLLTLDITKRVVHIQPYATDQLDDASLAFSLAEKVIKDNQNIVALLVSLSKMTELKNAYPSYYLDSEKFLKVVKDFYDKCS